jgi:hypothetical protein
VRKETYKIGTQECHPGNGEPASTQQKGQGAKTGHPLALSGVGFVTDDTEAGFHQNKRNSQQERWEQGYGKRWYEVARNRKASYKEEKSHAIQKQVREANSEDPDSSGDLDVNLASTKDGREKQAAETGE